MPDLRGDLTMNERSFTFRFMSLPHTEPNLDRRTQILDAALVCFAKCGFHQTSMHDISAQAGISVGLIYRYFANKEAVISAMADAHQREIQELLLRARQAPSLLESLEILFTAHCCENSPRLVSAFVVDLYAEASRNPQVANLVRGVLQTSMDGVTDLIARSPELEAAPHQLKPQELAELIFAVARGMLMLDVLQPAEMTAPERRERQLEVTRRLWRVLFKTESAPTYA
jgi:TetR/AcrR family transcriptional regulator, repressor for uid operon